MRKIDRKTADPEILAAYEAMRFERRYPMLGKVINAVRVVAYLGVVPIIFLPEEKRPSALIVWFAVVGAAILMELVLLIAWLPSSLRLKGLALMVVFFAVVGVMFAAFFFGMDRWMSSLG